jgi:type IV pilus assembly protein PilY1
MWRGLGIARIAAAGPSMRWAVGLAPLMWSAPAHAGAPVLEIDSLPIAAACAPVGGAGTASGAALLRPAARPAAMTSGAMSDPPSPPALPPSTASAGELYQSTMALDDWGGHFSRYILPGGGVGAVPALAWDAGAILTGKPGRPPMPAPEQRKIYTAIAQAGGTLAMIPFAWPALSPGQQSLLNQDDQSGELRLAYLRGDRTQEGRSFRRRSSVLGDSVHSIPVYVGPLDRRAAVYLGANDGMLHAFDASTGEEVFAYVPEALIAQLHYLADPAYVHRAYVDGPASAGEAFIGDGRKTVLVSGMGGGAQGVFALDVSDPRRFADGLGVLWEFTDRHDAMMGNVTTLPQIAKLGTRRSGGVVTYRYFAIVASGLNNYAADGNASGAGKGALFLLALDKPRDAPWKLNDNYYRLITPVAEPALANALSAPVLLADSDGAVRYAYAGDLQGNLWRFDFSGSAPWAKAVGPGANSTPLFVARDANGQRQPITQQPLLAYASERGYMVMFGTGKLIEAADRASARYAPQSYYAILDSLQSPADLVANRRQLTQRFLDGGTGKVLFSISGARRDSGSKGWYVDFLRAQDSGERSINGGLLADGQVLFNTVLPGADPCAATRGRAYALNVLTGLAGDSIVTAIVPGDEPIVGLLLPDYAPTPALLPQSAVRDSGGPAGRISVKATAKVVNVSPNGVTVVGQTRSVRRAGRLSWREVANWRELHEAVK